MHRIWLILAACGACAGQVSRDPKEIDLGRATFRIYCSPCHGIAGGGGRGPDLTRGTYSNGDQDADLYRVITEGVPGTEMPALGGTAGSENIWRLVSYIRSIARRDVQPPAGNAASGETVFWGKAGCGKCHAIGSRGGRLGPDLTRAGRQRSLEYLRESIVAPSNDVTPGYATITVVARDGRKIVGVQKGYDNFSAQLTDPAGNFHSFDRAEVKSIQREMRSLMPEYGNMLSKSEVEDVLAYLVGLRGEESR